MPPKSIDDIVIDLSKIVDWARENKSRIGYFAAMYRKVTSAIKAAIETGEFEDAERMARLDVVFAQRYIDASAEFTTGSRSRTHGRSRSTLLAVDGRSSSNTC